MKTVVREIVYKTVFTEVVFKTVVGEVVFNSSEVSELTKSSM